MNNDNQSPREGSLEAPTRHPIDWQDPKFFDQQDLLAELERVFDICHGCRRCFNLCHSFPLLFDAIDESDTGELDGVEKSVYWQVAEHCYLCDMCFMSKCPYVPPHEWNIDFPHLMLRTKAVRFKQGHTKFRDKFLTSTDSNGKNLAIPLVAQTVNQVNQQKFARQLLEKTIGIHHQAPLPPYQSNTLRKRLKKEVLHSPVDAELLTAEEIEASPIETTDGSRPILGRVVLFTTCYANYNEPQFGEDLVAVFKHNGILLHLPEHEVCCGMPKMELGDLESVHKLKNRNVPELVAWIREGWDVITPVPSCTLMFKQELPLLYKGDWEVETLARHSFDPFEYLALWHKQGQLNTEFKTSLGKIAYHVPCHLRVQNIGLKTKEILSLVPDTEVEAIERCSGHNGTYAVKKETHELSVKIGKPVANRVEKIKADHYGSDCPMAGRQLQHILQADSPAEHPMSLLRQAYGI